MPGAMTQPRIRIVDGQLCDQVALYEAVKRKYDSNYVDPIFLSYGAFLNHLADNIYLTAYAGEGDAQPALVGHASLTSLDMMNRKAEFGLVLHYADWEGKGVGTRLHEEALAVAFRRLCLNRIYGRIAKFRDRAIRLYEKAGWTLEGVDRGSFHYQGQFYDEVRVGMLRSEWLDRQQA